MSKATINLSEAASSSSSPPTPPPPPPPSSFFCYFNSETLSFEEESISFSTNSINLLLLFVIEWYHFEVGNFSINFDLRVAIIMKTFAVNKDTSLGFA